jgi:hypothetical protein
MVPAATGAISPVGILVSSRTVRVARREDLELLLEDVAAVVTGEAPVRVVREVHRRRLCSWPSCSCYADAQLERAGSRAGTSRTRPGRPGILRVTLRGYRPECDRLRLMEKLF